MIASHAGYRFGGQKYNLTDGTIARIAARGGVVGLIFAQHQINDGLRRTDTKTLAQSLDVLDRHIEAIGPDHVAIGSDLDGFIKPTIGGVETAADLKPFADGAAGAPSRSRRTASCSENALRVINRRFASAATVTPRISRHVVAAPRRRPASAPHRTPGSAARCPTLS